MIEIDYPQAAHQLGKEIVLLIIQGGAAKVGDSASAVDYDPVFFPQEGVIPGIFHPLGNLVQRPLPIPFLPVKAVGRAVQHPGQPVGIQFRFIAAVVVNSVQVEQGSALAAKSPLIDGVVRIAADTKEPAARDVTNGPAATGAIGTNGSNLFGPFQPRGKSRITFPITAGDGGN